MRENWNPTQQTAIMPATSSSSSLSLVSPSSFDCSRLLHYADRAENDFLAAKTSTTPNFGHPDPPDLHVCQVEVSPLIGSPLSASTLSLPCNLLVAYTKHTVSAQLFALAAPTTTTSSNHAVVEPDGKIQEICMLPPDERTRRDSSYGTGSVEHDDTTEDDYNDQISCLTVVPLAPPGKPAESSSSSIASMSSLLKGFGPLSETADTDTPTPSTRVASHANTPNERRYAIVFGTTHGNLYTVEVSIRYLPYISKEPATGISSLLTLERILIDNEATAIRTSLFQVLPLDRFNAPNDKQERRWRKRYINYKKQSTTINSSDDGHCQMSFAPTGGVINVTSYDIATTHGTTRGKSANILWIVYGDSTLVRLCHAACFPSIWQRAAANGRSVEDECRLFYRQHHQQHKSNASNYKDDSTNNNQYQPLVRCKVRLPQHQCFHGNTADSVLVVPLPRHFPSPTSPLRALLLSTVANEPQSHGKASSLATKSFIQPQETIDALVFGNGQSNIFPTLCFFTSDSGLDILQTVEAGGVGGAEHMFASAERSSNHDDGKNLESVSRALMGSAMGALRWSLGGSTRNLVDVSERSSSNDIGNNSRHGRSAPSKLDYSSHIRISDSEGFEPMDNDGDEMMEDNGLATSPFPSLWNRPVELSLSSEFHDAPRNVGCCSVDPDGILAAVTDGLGRVMLIDLISKQLIRIWKGFRDASCYWIKAPAALLHSDSTISSPWQSGSTKPLLYLVIHARQKRVVEIWRVRQASRVCSIPVCHDARILQFTTSSESSPELLVSCYLVHSSFHGGNRIEPIRIIERPAEDVVRGLITPPRGTISVPGDTSINSTPSRKSALRLKHLQQLLSAGSIVYSKEDLQNALREINSLADLSIALDLLATGSMFEDRLGVKGSTFHRDALAYCRGVLTAAIHKGKPRSDATSRENPHVLILSHKIEYHTQVSR